jgi:hypothetical protein
MNAVVQFATTTISLAAMIVLSLLALGFVVDEIGQIAPRFSCPIQEANYWLRGFGP